MFVCESAAQFAHSISEGSNIRMLLLVNVRSLFTVVILKMQGSMHKPNPHDILMNCGRKELSSSALCEEYQQIDHVQSASTLSF